MSVTYTPLPITGANSIEINENFSRIQQALLEVLGREGTTPNQMEADIDLNGNDVINVDNLHANNLVIDNTSLNQEVQNAADSAAAAAVSESNAADSVVQAEEAADAISGAVFRSFDDKAEMIADTDLLDNQTVYVRDTGHYIIVPASTYTANGGTVIDLTGSGLQAVLAPGEMLVNVAAVLADTRPAAWFTLDDDESVYGTLNGHSYKPVSSGAHITTAGSVGLKAVASAAGEAAFAAFGAIGDNSTDDTDAVDAAVDAAAADGFTVVGDPGHVYRMTSHRDWSGSSYSGLAIKRAAFDFSVIGDTDRFCSLGGEVEDVTTITADVAQFANTFTVADASSLAAGDMLEIASTQLTHDATNYTRQELQEIESIDGSDVTIRGQMKWDYTASGNTITVRKVTPVEDVLFEDVTFIGKGETADPSEGQRGPQISYSRNLVCRRVKVVDAWRDGLTVRSGLNPLADQCHAEGSLRPETGYGIYFIDSDEARIINPTGWNCRHAVEVGSGNNVEIINPKVRDCPLGQGVSSHGGANFLTVSGGEAVGCRGGARLRGANLAIEFFKALGYTGNQGIGIGEDNGNGLRRGLSGTNLVVRGCEARKDPNSADPDLDGIVVLEELIDAVIEDNIVAGCRSGIRLGGYRAARSSVSHNKVSGATVSGISAVFGAQAQDGSIARILTDMRFDDNSFDNVAEACIQVGTTQTGEGAQKGVSVSRNHAGAGCYRLADFQGPFEAPTIVCNTGFTTVRNLNFSDATFENKNPLIADNMNTGSNNSDNNTVGIQTTNSNGEFTIGMIGDGVPHEPMIAVMGKGVACGFSFSYNTSGGKITSVTVTANRVSDGAAQSGMTCKYKIDYFTPDSN